MRPYLHPIPFTLLPLLLTTLLTLTHALPWPPGPIDANEAPHDNTPVIFFGAANEVLWRQDILMDRESEFTPHNKRINFKGIIYRLGNPAGNCCAFWPANYTQFVTHGSKVYDIDPPQAIHWGYCMTDRVCWMEYGGEPGGDM